MSKGIVLIGRKDGSLDIRRARKDGSLDIRRAMKVHQKVSLGSDGGSQGAHIV